jgi:hypothetical protein
VNNPSHPRPGAGSSTGKTARMARTHRSRAVCAVFPPPLGRFMVSTTTDTRWPGLPICRLMPHVQYQVVTNLVQAARPEDPCPGKC